MNHIRVFSELAVVFEAQPLLERCFGTAEALVEDYCRMRLLFSEKLPAPRRSVFTAARQAERSSAACSSGIDCDSSRLAVPCRVAHSAKANRVCSSGAPPSRFASWSSTKAKLGLDSRIGRAPSCPFHHVR